MTNSEIQKYCKARLFSEVGKRTPIAIRFSTVGMLGHHNGDMNRYLKKPGG